MACVGGFVSELVSANSKELFCFVLNMLSCPDTLMLYFTVSVTLCQLSSDPLSDQGTSDYHAECFGLGLNITDDPEEQLHFFDDSKYIKM